MKTLLLLLAFAPFAHGAQAAWSWCEQGGQTVYTGVESSFTQVQQSYPQCTVTVYLTGTTTLATIYSDNNGTPLANSFLASATGYFTFYAPNGRYDIALSSAGFPSPITIRDVLLYDPQGPNGVPAVCNGSSNDTAGFAALAASTTPTHVLIPQGSTCSVNQTMTLPATVNIDIAQGGQLQVGSGFVVTLLGPLTAPATYVFPGAGKVSFAGSTAQANVLPQWFGALANGTHNDATAINAAFTAAAGTTVFFGSGTYAQSTQVTPTATTNITCASGATFFALSGFSNPQLINPQAGSFAINNCTLNANNLTGVSGINVGTSNVSITNNQILNWGGSGVNVYAGNNILVKGNTITGSVTTPYVNTAVAIGGYCYSGFRVMDNTITVSANGGSGTADGVAFKTSGACSPNPGDVEIGSNHIYQLSTIFAIEGGWFGNTPQHYAGGQAQKVNIHDNFLYVYGSGTQGAISLDNVLYYQVHHNTIDMNGLGAGAFGIIEIANHSAYGLIDGNHVVNAAVGAPGVDVNGCAEHVHIVDNDFGTAVVYYGCSFNAGSGPDVLPLANDVLIEGNIFTNSSSAGSIQLQLNYSHGSDFLVVSDAQIKNNSITGTGSSTSYGIGFTFASGQSWQNLDIEGNHFRNLQYALSTPQGSGALQGSSLRMCGNFYTSVVGITSNGFWNGSPALTYETCDFNKSLVFNGSLSAASITGGAITGTGLTCPTGAATPTAVVGSAAGTGATVTVTGCNTKGTVVLTGGTSPSGTAGNLVTVSFNPAAAGHCLLTNNQNGTATVINQLQAGNPTNQFTINGFLPTASTNYFVNYLCTF